MGGERCAAREVESLRERIASARATRRWLKVNASGGDFDRASGRWLHTATTRIHAARRVQSQVFTAFCDFHRLRYKHLHTLRAFVILVPSRLTESGGSAADLCRSSEFCMSQRYRNRCLMCVQCAILASINDLYF